MNINEVKFQSWKEGYEDLLEENNKLKTIINNIENAASEFNSDDAIEVINELIGLYKHHNTGNRCTEEGCSGCDKKC